MATWTVSDELDARLRAHLGMEDVSAYVEGLIAEQFDDDEDPAYRAAVDAKIKQSQAEFADGKGVDARQAMREIADEFGIDLSR